MNITGILTSIPADLIYWLIGLMIGVESVGVPLPGEATIVAASLLSLHPDSTLNPWLIATAACIGAVLGDSVGYSVGKRYGTRLMLWMTTKTSHFTVAHLRYCEHIFARWGVGAIFFGRFMALLRMLAGPLAGALKVPYGRFLAANIGGAIFWAYGTVGLVVWLGEAAHQYLKEGGWIALGAVLVLALIASFGMRRRLEQRVREFETELRAGEGSPGPDGTASTAGEHRSGSTAGSIFEQS